MQHHEPRSRQKASFRRSFARSIRRLPGAVLVIVVLMVAGGAQSAAGGLRDGLSSAADRAGTLRSDATSASDSPGDWNDTRDAGVRGELTALRTLIRDALPGAEQLDRSDLLHCLRNADKRIGTALSILDLARGGAAAGRTSQVTIGLRQLASETGHISDTLRGCADDVDALGGPEVPIPFFPNFGAAALAAAGVVGALLVARRR